MKIKMKQILKILNKFFSKIIEWDLYLYRNLKNPILRTLYIIMAFLYVILVLIIGACISPWIFIKEKRKMSLIECWNCNGTGTFHNLNGDGKSHNCKVCKGTGETNEDSNNRK